MGTKTKQQSYLTKLKVLTEALPSWKPCDEDVGWLSVELEKGSSHLRNLMHRPRIAVSDVIFSIDALYEEHSHKQKEFMIVYAGEIHVATEKKTYVLKAGDSVYFEANEAHSVWCPVASRALAVTIPAADEFPRGHIANGKSQT